MVHTHSSTVATNALIERRGARIGLLVSSGFRDLFELQRLALPHPMRFTSRRPQPLVPRALVREIGGRIAADGSEIEPLVTEDVLKAARELAALEIEIAVVALLHSYRNPAHEESVRRIAEESGLGLRVELSSEAWPQAREYERGVLTAINASIRPVIEGYVDRLTRGLVNESGRSAAANGATSFARRRYCSVAIDPTDVRRASEERLRARCHPQLEGWRNGNSLGSRQRRRRPRCRVARNSKFGSLAMHSRYCDRRRRINPPSVPLVRLKVRHRSPAFPISPGLIPDFLFRWE
jgi:hypothetical protein